MPPNRYLRRALVQGLGGGISWALAGRPALAQPVLTETAWRKLGLVSLLGNSIRIYARENREVLFADLRMDAVAFEVLEKAMAATHPQVPVDRLQARGDIDTNEQIAIGTAAARRGELPAWVLEAARAAGWSHLLLVGSDVGAMEFKTGLTQVVGNGSVAGVGFWVGADYRWKNLQTGVTFDGYLAPFVQLRVTLFDMAGPRVLASTQLSEGYASGPAESEAPNPWNFLNRTQKAAALDGLLRRNLERGAVRLLAGGR